MQTHSIDLLVSASEPFLQLCGLIVCFCQSVQVTPNLALVQGSFVGSRTGSCLSVTMVTLGDGRQEQIFLSVVLFLNFCHTINLILYISVY